MKILLMLVHIEIRFKDGSVFASFPRNNTNLENLMRGWIKSVVFFLRYSFVL